MRVLFIFTSTTSDDHRAWSGTMHHSFVGLQHAGCEVDYLCALRDYRETFIDKLICTYWLRGPAKIGRNIRMDEAFYSVRLFKQTLRNFDYTPYDIIFVPTHIAIVNALPKKIKAKVVHLVDATVDSLFEYYAEFSNLIFHNYWEAHILGKRAFRRADLIIASSDWCKRNAISDYGVSPDKIKVVEFGANIKPEDVPAEARQIDGKQHLAIYWSGVNWERKGGDVALACCEEMVRRGYEVTFNITGMRVLPDVIKSIPYVHDHGFLNKNNPKDYARLIEIMNGQDIFLFPSKAECSSIALCEANGFGLPCFVYDTGGTANYVRNGENGYMLPLTADGKQFADRIVSCIENREMDRLSLGAVKRYRDKLNWTVWSNRVKEILQQL